MHRCSHRPRQSAGRARTSLLARQLTRCEAQRDLVFARAREPLNQRNRQRTASAAPPNRHLETPHPRLIALLGSTIGNLYPQQREELLGSLARELREDDALLLGLDLVKDVARLEAAYHDRTGVTEAFVRNALTAVNRELGATFEQGQFVYEPRWDPEHEWMDIALRALDAHVVAVPELKLEIAFQKGERLRVEISSKFRRNAVERELERAALSVRSWWTDRLGDFAVVLAG
jgi:L-histidine N-alpha-methyltransferase